MTTPKQASAVVQQDIQNVEHLGDWDHGMEPNVSDAAAAAAGEPNSKGHQGNICVPVVKKAQAIAAKVMHSMEQAAHNMGETAAHANDENQLKEQVERHSEEEVAGMKLCVSKTVDQDSFVAPC